MNNINYEHDTRHDVSNKALGRMRKTMYSQDHFGIKKYGKSLHPAMNYDWLDMAQEELADMLKYLQCERDRKESVIGLLKLGLETDDPKVWIREALELLETGGTGK
jgi:hypothetical protein